MAGTSMLTAVLPRVLGCCLVWLMVDTPAVLPSCMNDMLEDLCLTPSDFSFADVLVDTACVTRVVPPLVAIRVVAPFGELALVLVTRGELMNCASISDLNDLATALAGLKNESAELVVGKCGEMINDMLASLMLRISGTQGQLKEMDGRLPALAETESLIDKHHDVVIPPDLVAGQVPSGSRPRDGLHAVHASEVSCKFWAAVCCRIGDERKFRHCAAGGATPRCDDTRALDDHPPKPGPRSPQQQQRARFEAEQWAAPPTSSACTAKLPAAATAGCVAVTRSACSGSPRTPSTTNDSDKSWAATR